MESPAVAPRTLFLEQLLTYSLIPENVTLNNVEKDVRRRLRECW
jgi:hypothetical protein